MKKTYYILTKFEFTQILELFATNKEILGICSITSLIGFAMTIYVSLKTKSIDKAILHLRETQDFNNKRKKNIKTLESYQSSLNVDGADVYKIRINILNDMNIIYQSHKDLLCINQRVTFWALKKQLKKDKGINVSVVCNLMSEIIGYMSKDKEN